MVVLVYLHKLGLKYFYLQVTNFSAPRLLSALNYHSDGFSPVAFLTLVNSVPKLNIYQREAYFHRGIFSLLYNFLLSKTEL